MGKSTPASKLNFHWLVGPKFGVELVGQGTASVVLYIPTDGNHSVLKLVDPLNCADGTTFSIDPVPCPGLEIALKGNLADYKSSIQLTAKALTGFGDKPRVHWSHTGPVQLDQPSSFSPKLTRSAAGPFTLSLQICDDKNLCGTSVDLRIDPS